MLELTASKRTFTECICAYSSKDPNGRKDIRVCLPRGRQKGGSCSLQKQAGGKHTLTTINGTSQSISTGRNDRPPRMARKGNNPFMAGSVPRLPTTAICTNAILGFPGSVDVDQGSPIESICGPRGEFLKTAHRSERPPRMARKSNHAFMGGPYRVCQRQEAAQMQS